MSDEFWSFEANMTRPGWIYYCDKRFSEMDVKKSVFEGLWRDGEKTAGNGKTCYELLRFCGSIVEVCERSECKLKQV